MRYICFGNKFCLEKRLRLIKALNNRFFVKFMKLEIGLLSKVLSYTVLFGYVYNKALINRDFGPYGKYLF